MRPTDLPGDLPDVLERFGTDTQCRDHLVRARWPDGFGCAGCGHDRAWAHKLRLIDECTACGKQHSLLAGTIFEQTKTALARWFLAIFLVTSGCAWWRQTSTPITASGSMVARSAPTPASTAR